MKPYLSVIIPAYNEERRIEKTLNVVYQYLTQQAFTWELLIVLDGVKDNTLGVIEAFAKGKENIRWINRLENRGKGYTVREGMLAAKGEVRLFTDADNSTDISHFDQMIPLFKSGHDVVIATRDRKDVPTARQAVPQPFLKRLFGNLGNLFIQVVAVPGIWDTQCGFKAFSATAVNRIFKVAKSNGWVFDIEALALAREFGFKIGLVGAYWEDDPNTHVKTSDYIKVILETVKIRLDLISGAYNRNFSETAVPKAKTDAPS